MVINLTLLHRLAHTGNHFRGEFLHLGPEGFYGKCKHAAIPEIIPIFKIFAGQFEVRFFLKRCNPGSFTALDISIPCFRTCRFDTEGNNKTISCKHCCP